MKHKKQKYIFWGIICFLLVAIISQYNVINQLKNENDNFYKSDLDLHYHLIRTTAGLAKHNVTDPGPTFEVVDNLLSTLVSKMENDDLYKNTLYQQRIKKLSEESKEILNLLHSNDYSISMANNLDGFSGEVQKLFDDMLSELRRTNNELWIEYINSKHHSEELDY